MDTKRSRSDQRIIVAATVTAILLLAAGMLLGWLCAREMRQSVARQFNDEQLAIARSIKQIIEKDLASVKTEISLLAAELSAMPPGDGNRHRRIQRSHERVLTSGVWQIELVDRRTETSWTYLPFHPAPVRQPANRKAVSLENMSTTGSGKIWISRVRNLPNGMGLTMGTVLEDDQQRLLFHVDLNRFLTPLLYGVRSGKSGYAWVIDEKGDFLYHPDPSFAGKNAFEIRQEKYPDGSFSKINFLQKASMLKGLEGTGAYSSHWHRGITGKVDKLIAFSPIGIPGAPLRNWSVAVVAPVSEIEAAIRQGHLRLFLLQGIVTLAVILGALSVILLEKRWSHRLEEMVVKRTDAHKQSEEKYRSLVESAEDFIFSVSPGGYLKSMNSYTARFFGGRPEAFAGCHLSALFDEPVAKKQLRLIRMVSAFGRGERDKFQLTLGERPIWIDASFMPLKDKAGKVSDILCIARDITENKTLERQLINAEKLASMGTLAAGVAHEVNNPLAVILGFCDLLLQKTDPHSQSYQDLKTIERQGLLCKRVVENLLSFSRLKTGPAEMTDINECLDDILHVVKHTLKMNAIALTVTKTANMPLVTANPRQLQQVFLNLINNAMAAMENGGHLRAETRLERSSGKVVVTFTDDGSGISAEHMDHIFEPFFTTKPEGQGTGLGLFVSYGIIAQYGGSIECASPSGTGPDGCPGGTTFTVKLPIK